MSVCVCGLCMYTVSVCVTVHVLTLVCRGQKSVLGAFPNCSPASSLCRISYWTWSSPSWLDCLASETFWILRSLLPYRCMSPSPTFFMGARDAKSGPHTYAASVLPVEPSPQPLFVLLRGDWIIEVFTSPTGPLLMSSQQDGLQGSGISKLMSFSCVVLLSEEAFWLWDCALPCLLHCKCLFYEDSNRKWGGSFGMTYLTNLNGSIPVRISL